MDNRDPTPYSVELEGILAEDGQDVQIHWILQLVLVFCVNSIRHVAQTIEFKERFWCQRFPETSPLRLVELKILRVELNKVVGKSEFPFVGLSIPQVGAGWCTEDRVRNTEFFAYLENLTLVKISDELKVSDSITGLAEIEEITVLVVISSTEHDARESLL